MILFVLLLFHALLGYAGPATFSPIKAVVLDTLFAIEILALTCCAVFSLIDASWVGYALVYFAVIIDWLEFSVLAIDTEKVYEVTPKETIFIPSTKTNGAGGTISEGWREIEVYVCGDEAFQAAKQGKPFYAKFEKIEQPATIWMQFIKE